MKYGGMSTSDSVTTQSPTLSSEDRSARIAVTVFPLLILAAFAIAMITPDTFKPLTSGALIIAVVICHNLLGYLFGYLAGRVGRGSDKAARSWRRSSVAGRMVDRPEWTRLGRGNRSSASAG